MFEQQTGGAYRDEPELNNAESYELQVRKSGGGVGEICHTQPAQMRETNTKSRVGKQSKNNSDVHIQQLTMEG